ncbi:MAG: hypothetical protein R3C32_09040 [Chloroflexota bacterium]
MGGHRRRDHAHDVPDRARGRRPCPAARRRGLTGDLRATSHALYAEHVALGGRLIDFSGWELPVQYAGIVEEHRQVRTAAGLFDPSHMGEVWPRRPGRRRCAGPCAGVRPTDARARPCPVLAHVRRGWRHHR